MLSRAVHPKSECLMIQSAGFRFVQIQLTLLFCCCCHKGSLSFELNRRSQHRRILNCCSSSSLSSSQSSSATILYMMAESNSDSTDAQKFVRLDTQPPRPNACTYWVTNNLMAGEYPIKSDEASARRRIEEYL